MNVKVFFDKFKSWYIWGNLIAMLVVVIVLCILVNMWLGSYTRHGEGFEVPDLTGMDFDKAEAMLEKDGILLETTDSGYNKRLPGNSILTQTPGAGTNVKSGRTIYVVVNSTSSPVVAIPDLIDNSSFREAQARLQAIGFRLLPPKVIDGEKDWVYGIMNNGRQLQTGERVSIELPLTLVIGNGEYEEDDSAADDAAPAEGPVGEVDEFEEVVGND